VALIVVIAAVLSLPLFGQTECSAKRDKCFQPVPRDRRPTGERRESADGARKSYKSFDAMKKPSRSSKRAEAASIATGASPAVGAARKSDGSLVVLFGAGAVQPRGATDERVGIRHARKKGKGRAFFRLGLDLAQRQPAQQRYSL